MKLKPTRGEHILREDQKKLRGGYYTPPDIAYWLCSWAIRTSKDRILEPSCGDGAFLHSAARRLVDLGSDKRAICRQMTGVELFSSEADKASEQMQKLLGKSATSIVQCSDFFTWSSEQPNTAFDCVLGNPPFIRYQNFPEPCRSKAISLLRSLGLAPNKLTNIWVPFVAVATAHLSPGGRLALVLPAELLQVTYAAQLRLFLVDHFDSMDIVACNQLIFKRAEQEVILFLANGRKDRLSNAKKCLIDLWQAKNIEEILSTDPTSRKKKKARKLVNHDSEKWLKYFLTSKEISLMRRLRSSKQVVNLSYHASIDVGVVTGKNEFFVLSKSDAERHGIERHVVPLVGRSFQLKGAMIGKDEFADLAEAGYRVFLFHINGRGRGSISNAARKYIDEGEKKGFHKGYKCSIRKPWYQVPSAWVPEFFFFRQIYDFPRIVINLAEATSTDTIHRMKCKDDPKLLMGSFYTHLTAASSEIEGRSYGGGVLELEPTEAERLIIPRNLNHALSPEEIDLLIRAGRLEDVLKEHDRKVLMENIGLSQRECNMLRRIWIKMCGRRQSRKKR